MKIYSLTEFTRPLQSREVPTPVPSGTEVLLRVKAAGVCRTDLHIWEGGLDIGQCNGTSVSNLGIRLPLTMGHEIVGEVVEVGPQIENPKQGETRLVFPWIGCGQCPMCLAGDENLCGQPRYLGFNCDGGYADYILVPHPRYLLDIEGLDPVTAASYACPGLATYCALQKVADVLDSEPILIIGSGGLGLMALTLLNAMEGKGAFVVDVDARKRQAALKAGAIAAIDGSMHDASRKVILSAGGPVRVAIDFVGSSQTAALGFDCLAKGGKLIVLGLFGGAAQWSLPRIPLTAATILGTHVGNLAALTDLLDLVRRASVPPIPVTTRPMSEVNEALADVHGGRLIGRVVLIP